MKGTYTEMVIPRLGNGLYRSAYRSVDRPRDRSACQTAPQNQTTWITDDNTCYNIPPSQSCCRHTRGDVTVAVICFRGETKCNE